MIYFILSVGAMILTALCFRMNADRGGTPLGFNGVYRAATAAFWVVGAGWMIDGARVGSLLHQTGLLSVFAIAFFLTAGFASVKIVQLGPLGISWTIMRCSMVISTLASIVVWKEVTPAQPRLFAGRLLGVALITTAVVLFGLDHARRTEQGPAPSRRALRRWIFWLAVVLLAQGGWEICLRATKDICRDDQARLIFLTSVFVGGGLVTTPVTLALKAMPNRADLLFGAAAGLCSAVGSGLRPWAIRDLGGTFVFPATTILAILGAQAAGIVLWHERPGRRSAIGLALAVAGILLLTLPIRG